MELAGALVFSEADGQCRYSSGVACADSEDGGEQGRVGAGPACNSGCGGGAACVVAGCSEGGDRADELDGSFLSLIANLLEMSIAVLKTFDASNVPGLGGCPRAATQRHRPAAMCLLRVHTGWSYGENGCAGGSNGGDVRIWFRPVPFLFLLLVKIQQVVDDGGDLLSFSLSG
eukprot:2951041-Pleurochrysis_carterae.AAC.1